MDAEWHVLASIVRQLSEQTSTLRELEATPQAAGEPKFRYCAAERCLEVGAMCCLDAGNHLIARLGLPQAQSYGEIGGVLHSASVISKTAAEFMGQLADLRNRLAHVYWRIRRDEIDEVLPDVIPKFEAFAQEIRQFLESRG